MITPNVIRCNLVCSSCGPIALDDVNKMAKTFSCERGSAGTAGTALRGRSCLHTGLGAALQVTVGEHGPQLTLDRQTRVRTELCLHAGPRLGSAYKQTRKQSLSLYFEEAPMTGQAPRLSELLSFTLNELPLTQLH